MILSMQIFRILTISVLKLSTQRIRVLKIRALKLSVQSIYSVYRNEIKVVRKSLILMLTYKGINSIYSSNLWIYS